MSRHKWETDDRGNKFCEKCGSKINANVPENFALAKYLETDKGGYRRAVPWYPRCYPQPKSDTIPIN